MTFDRAGANGHTRCVTEHEKYALGATKPGGFAAGGFSAGGGGDNGGNNNNKDGAAAAPSGLEFLSERPPWRCSACNVSCTSRETLLSHAAGQKHRRRARAAAAAAAGAGAAEAPATPGGKAAAAEEEEVKEEKKEQAGSSSSDSSSSDSDSDDDKQKKKKKKKRGREEEQAGAAVDKAVLAKVLADARTKLAAKGKLKLDKLRALVTKRSGGKGKEKKGRGNVDTIVDAAVAELQAGGEGGSSKRAKLSKDGQKLKVVAA
jgi:cell growth-regulating nucleolar protein